VEDSSTQRVMLRHLLEINNYGVSEATNGREALERIEKSPPDLLISDVVMPIMDGYELCTAVKSNPDYQNIPVIILTALTDRNDIIKGLTCGADSFITKPYSENYLIERIEATLQNRKLRTSMSRESGFEVLFAGERHSITANRLQITELLLSTFENAVYKNQELNLLNKELLETKEKLTHLNELLELRLIELQTSKDQFKNLVTTIPDIVYHIDAKGYFVFINDAVEKIGYTAEELIGKHFSTIILSTDIAAVSREVVLPRYEGVMTGDKDAPKLFDERRSGIRKTTGLEIRLVPKGRAGKGAPDIVENLNSDLIMVEISSSGMYEMNPLKKIAIYVGSVGVIRDITDRKRMEDKLKRARDTMELEVRKRTQELREAQAHLIQSEKMTALGTMVAGVAHELNNPLMGILNFIQYCLKHTPDGDKKAAVLETAERETNRSIGIVQNLLTFARGYGDTSDMSRAHITDVFDRVEKLLRYRMEKERVVLIKDSDDIIPAIPMKTEEIQQVFVNLVVNALDALRDNINERVLAVEFFVKDAYVHVRITDNGCGIPTEHMGRVFDPFFTTKPVGKGTGLGLSISRNIVMNHGGSMTCTSRPGEGTGIEISLPVEPRGESPLYQNQDIGVPSGNG
jgi:PAS domain S-box-containing protein